jgi:hypothetical protein
LLHKLYTFLIQALVVQKPLKVLETASKKARIEELPDWVDAKWFRHTFIATYMAYVGQLMDPWDVPAKQAVEMMQKIWDGTGGQDYDITTSTAVYQKVCGTFTLDHKTKVYI